jgi:hypothetical protein
VRGFRANLIVRKCLASPAVDGTLARRVLNNLLPAHIADRVKPFAVILDGCRWFSLLQKHLPLRASILALCLLAPLQLLGQFSTVSCTHGETGTCRQATTCSQANVQAAVNASSAGGTGYASPTSFDGDGVYVPAGSCSWASAVSWSNKNINLIGNNPTITHSSDFLDPSVTSSGTTAGAFRVSGFTLVGGAGAHVMVMNGGAPPNSGYAGFYRIDHITYTESGGSDSFVWYGPVFGVMDHLNGTVSNKNHFLWALFYNGEYPGSPTLLMGQGIATGFPAGLGGQLFNFIEDSTFACTSGYGSAALTDSSSGVQRMVFRHNTVTGSCFHYAHWTRSGEWDGGVMEFYNNNYNCTASDCVSSGGYPGRFGAGTGVIHDNTINGYGLQAFNVDESRGCGAETSGFAGAVVNSNFDRNDGDASAIGWPAAGQIGTACIAGSCTPATMNSVPFIAWNNGTQSGCSTGGSCTNTVGFNVDGNQGSGSCSRPMGNYIKSTAHTSSGGLNGAVDIFSGSAKPSSVGIYTGIASYTPYTYPYPTTTGGGGTVSNPTFSPSPGSYGAAQTVTLSTSTGGATLCYTTDGSTPTTNGSGSCVHGSIYSIPFSVATTTTVKAIGTLSGSLDSSVVTGTYTINGSAAAPTFAPGAGSYGATQTVTISTSTLLATICYTTDGSAPTADGAGNCTHGTTYSSPVSVSTSQTLKAIASKTAFTDSSVSSAAYVINGAASTPTFSPVAGSYGPTQNVTISSSTAGSTLCYTTNGSSPTSSSPGVCAAGSTQYVAPVAVASSLTLKAIATKAGFTDSSIGSAAYVINGAVATPTFSPVAGAYGAAQTITIATATGSSTICYTTDGSTPTASGGTCTHGTTYSVPITVSTSQTVQAIGTKSGFSNSAVASAIYTINGTLPTPTFAPAAGGYSSAQTVTISAASGSAVVLVNTMQETANSNDTIGSSVHRNTYTNCATGYSGGALEPHGQPVGNLYCTAADKTAALAAGGPNQGVVTSTISGTGTTALDNGNGAGGTTSPSTVTATYAGSTGTACGAHGSSASGFVSGLNFADPGGSAQLVYGLTAAGSTSILTVSKYNSSADAGRYVAQRDCWTPNSVTVGGAHYESDYNYNTTGGTYMGFGKDYDMPNKKWRAGPQGAAWINEELCPVAGGACLTTWTVPAGDSVLVESYEHWNAGCTFSSSTACAFYDAIGLQLYNAGSPVGSMVYYNVRNASTHAVISFIPINKTSWTHPQYAIQHQWDENSGSAATLTATVPFSTAVAYYTTSGTATICYTTDGSTPTGDGAGSCTHGTTYTVPITVSSTTTVKAIATQAGFTDSAVGSATYTINGTAATPTFSPVAGTYSSTQSVTISSATAGATICYTTDGSTPTADGAGTCTHGATYSTAVSVPSSLTIQAIASKAAFTDSAVGSAAYIITSAVQVKITGVVKFSGTIQIQ